MEGLIMETKKNNKKRLSIYIDKDDFELLQYRANDQCRSLNSFITFLLKNDNYRFRIDNDDIIQSNFN